MRFPGQYYDAETGLHYNMHRYYDPDTGRYLTPDPIGLAGGINPFVYTHNNPINVIDPDGLSGIFMFSRPTPMIRPSPTGRLPVSARPTPRPVPKATPRPDYTPKPVWKPLPDLWKPTPISELPWWAKILHLLKAAGAGNLESQSMRNIPLPIPTSTQQKDGANSNPCKNEHNNDPGPWDPVTNPDGYI